MGTILEEDLTINPAINPLTTKNIEDHTDEMSEDSDINQASTSSCDQQGVIFSSGEDSETEIEVRSPS